MNLENKYFTIKNGVLLKFKDLKTDRISVPDGVKIIGEKAFFTSRIRSIVLPESLVSIEKKAFWGCNCLKSIVIPDSVKTIGNDAFAECSGLEKLVLGSGVEKIGCRAFFRCTNIIGDISGESVQSISQNAFSCCSYINSFDFPVCTSIDDFTFSGCKNMKSVTLGNIERIGYCTFFFCLNLEKFTVPESVQRIYSKAFDMCRNLSAEVPERLRISEKIGKEAFHGCKEVIYTA